MRRALRTARSRIAGFLVLVFLAAAIPLSLIGTSAQADVFPSRVTIKWAPKVTAFKGLVGSDLARCRARRVVVVFKARKGPDKKIGKDLTNRRGKWEVDVRRAQGRYYAKARRKVIPTYNGQHICQADRSPTIRVR